MNHMYSCSLNYTVPAHGARSPPPPTDQVKAMKSVMASESATRVIPQVARKWVPTAVGLGIIPLIIHPIDGAVTLAMDSSVRTWM